MLGSSIGAGLIGDMAIQLHLSKNQFLELYRLYPGCHTQNPGRIMESSVFPKGVLTSTTRRGRMDTGSCGALYPVIRRRFYERTEKNVKWGGGGGV